MRQLISQYAFDASAQQIEFSGMPAINLNRVLLITNITDNIIVFSFAAPSKGGTVDGYTLTLEYDTTTMSDTDELQIFYEYPDKSQFAISNIEEIGDFKYFGYEGTTGEWYIMRKEISTNSYLYYVDMAMSYAAGWSAKGTFTYTNFSNLMWVQA